MITFMSIRSASKAALREAPPLCCLFLIALAAGCGRVEHAALPSNMGSAKIVEIRENTQAQEGNLRIGLGYVRVSAAMDVAGSPRTLEAGLWIYVRKDPSKNKAASVRAGQLILVGATSLFVEEVRGGSPGAVRLAIVGSSSQSGAP